MHNAYEARDPQTTAWRDDVGRSGGTPPVAGSGSGGEFGGPPRHPAAVRPQHGEQAGVREQESDRWRRDARTDVEPAVPVGRQLRNSLERMSATIRRSVPLRTILFLLPPLALPALAFDLSVGGVLVVALTLLWLAAAAGLFCTLMLEGSDQVALRAIERRLAHVADGDRPSASSTGADDASLQEALVAIGAQLDALEGRIAALGAARVDDAPPILSDRPQERWSGTSQDEQYDRYGQTAVPDTNWGESRWRR